MWDHAWDVNDLPLALCSALSKVVGYIGPLADEEGATETASGGSSVLPHGASSITSGEGGRASEARSAIGLQCMQISQVIVRWPLRLGKSCDLTVPTGRYPVNRVHLTGGLVTAPAVCIFANETVQHAMPRVRWAGGW